MAEESDERSEEATQARREEFRKRGQVAFTRELSSALFLLLSFGGIYVLGRFYFAQMGELFDRSFGADMVSFVRKDGDFKPLLQFAGMKILFMAGPVMFLFMVVGVASSVLQFGFLTVEDALSPKLEKLDPIAGLGRMFSMKALVEGIKAVLKVSLVMGIAYLVLRREMTHFPLLVQYPVEMLFEYLGTTVGRLLGSLAVVMLVIAVADYFFQRWDLEKQMRMTKQEIKDEHKTREGDPLIKSRIRRLQRDVANRRMMQKVPKADVLITNPTHVAVALRYGDDTPSPQLIAKGADLVADKMRALAREHNIPIVENIPLARAIYRTMKLGQYIPRELYVAVAEVLSYVFKLKNKKKKAGF